MQFQDKFFQAKEVKKISLKSGLSLENNISGGYVDPVRQTKSGGDDLYFCIWPLLVLGRLIGVIPLAGLFQRKLESVSFRYKSVAVATSLLCMVPITLNLIMGLHPLLASAQRDAGSTAIKLTSLVYNGTGFCIYLYMLCNRNLEKLIECFWTWRDVKTTFYKEDLKLRRHILIFFAFMFTSGFLENIFFTFQIVKGAFYSKHGVTFSSFWKYWFDHIFEQPGKIMPYNLFVSMSIFISNKLVLYSWTLTDILICSMARAMYKRFELNLKAFEEAVSGRNEEKSIWIEAVKDHGKLIDVLNKFRDFLSPLIFLSIASSVYYIGLETFNFMVVNTDDGITNRLRGLWSFLNLIVRTFSMIHACARVNSNVHQFQHVLAKCPVSALSIEVEKAEFRLRTSNIGFEGLNCFTITNGFALTVFSAVFTFQIVLLQSTSTQ